MKDFKVQRYNGETLYNATITYKIDGVRLHVENGKYCSRAGKPLYNLPEGLDDGIYEVYRNNFKETIEVVRSSKTPKEPITLKEVYRLDEIDKRLLAGHLPILKQTEVEGYLSFALDFYLEGLVIHSDNKMYKVKKAYTEDIEVLSLIPGKGKHEGRVGALVTERGKVGTGLTDQEREEAKDWVGKIIEVGYMEITEAGKFRQPKFIRLREDKA